MALQFERRGSTWVCFDPQWELLLIARDLYHGTDRLLSTMTLARQLGDGTPNPKVMTERVNLLIGTQRRGFAKECARRLASGPGTSEGIEVGINSMIDGLLEHLLQLHGEIEVHALDDIILPADLTPRYALWPFVPASRPGMVVGPSGQGKSGFAGFGGLSVVTGKILLPRIDPQMQGPVLYIGQEEDKEQWAARITQMCRGHGIEIPKHYYYLRLSTGSLIDSAEMIAEQAAVKHAVLVIVDSAQATWGTESESVRGYASSWFNAVDQLGVPTLIVEHPNLAETKKPIAGGFAAGSSVKRDRVGHAWNLKSIELPVREGFPTRYHVTLTDAKRNYVARQPNVTYETLIHGHDWIRFIEAEEMTAETVVDGGSRNDDAMASFMRDPDEEYEEGWLVSEVVKRMGASDDRRIRQALTADYWRPARWNPTIQYRFEQTEGTGAGRNNPAKFRLITRSLGVQMSMLPGDLDEGLLH